MNLFRQLTKHFDGRDHWSAFCSGSEGRTKYLHVIINADFGTVDVNARMLTFCGIEFSIMG